MMWEEWAYPQQSQQQDEFHLNFDLVSLLSQRKDYYQILEVDYDATDEDVRSSYIRLALKWHPDKRKEEDNTTSRFQEINEAYQVLNNPEKRRDYDMKGRPYVYDCGLIEYLDRHKGLILTCNGLGIRHSICNKGEKRLPISIWLSEEDDRTEVGGISCYATK